MLEPVHNPDLVPGLLLPCAVPCVLLRFGADLTQSRAAFATNTAPDGWFGAVLNSVRSYFEAVAACSHRMLVNFSERAKSFEPFLN